MRTRLSLEVSASVRTQLETVQARTEAGSITEVIRRALALYDFVTQIQKDGKLIIRHKDGDEEVLRVL